MWHALVTSIAVLVAAQVRAGGEAVKASDAEGWLAPTRIRLDLREKTVAEIVDAINAETKGSPAVHHQAGSFARGMPQAPGRHTSADPGFNLFDRDMPQAPGSASQRYSVVEPAPIPFWEAVDRVGLATRTWPETGNLPRGGRGILLIPASADRGFAVNDGAFRVVLTSVYYASGFQFAPHFFNQDGVEQPRTDGSSRHPRLTASLAISAEPRLKIIRPVELVVREAIDDRGRALIPAVPWRQSLEKPSARGFPDQEGVGIPLRPLDDPGRSIKRLAGSLALEVGEAPPGSATAMVELRFDFADVPMP